MGWEECSRRIDCGGWCEHKTILCGHGEWYVLYYGMKPCRGGPAPRSCNELSLSKVLTAVADCHATKDLPGRAAQGAGLAPPVRCGDDSQWDPKEKRIELSPGSSDCRAILALVQEYTNAVNTRQFARIFEQAKRGEMSRDGFIMAIERIEYAAAPSRVHAFDQCREQWGCADGDLSQWERVAAVVDFEAYFEMLLATSPEHPGQYGEWWDRECKRAYDAKHERR